MTDTMPTISRDTILMTNLSTIITIATQPITTITFMDATLTIATIITTTIAITIGTIAAGSLTCRGVTSVPTTAGRARRRFQSRCVRSMSAAIRWSRQYVAGRTSRFKAMSLTAGEGSVATTQVWRRSPRPNLGREHRMAQQAIGLNWSKAGAEPLDFRGEVS